MKEPEFKALCVDRGLSEQQTAAAVQAVRGFEQSLECHGSSFESADTGPLRDCISRLMARGENSSANLLAITRYSNMVGNYAFYIYLLGVLGGQTVVPSLRERTAELAGEATSDAVFDGIELPPLGSPQECYPESTEQVVQRLRASLQEDTCKDILAGNHHRVPVQAFDGHREVYCRAGIDGLLKYRHESLLLELEEHARSGKPWYEQRITPEVVDFVRRNPEIQSGVRVGNSIFVAKIPYSPVAYLGESDVRMKRYHQCHCPLARASILDEAPPVSSLFCYCSGGYEKLVFDVVFGRPVTVEVLESALAGDIRCRFRIEIPEGCA